LREQDQFVRPNPDFQDRQLLARSAEDSIAIALGAQSSADAVETFARCSILGANIPPRPRDRCGSSQVSRLSQRAQIVWNVAELTDDLRFAEVSGRRSG
jgi:hypothetical protein